MERSDIVSGADALIVSMPNQGVPKLNFKGLLGCRESLRVDVIVVMMG